MKFTLLWMSILNISNICCLRMLLSLLSSMSIWMMLLSSIIHKSSRALIISCLFTDHLLLLYLFLHHIPTCFIVRISTCHFTLCILYLLCNYQSWWNASTNTHLFIFTQFPCFSSFLTYSLFCILIHLQRQIVMLSSHS